MSHYTKFAVAGGIGGGTAISANLGNVIVRDLLATKSVEVTVLGRESSVSSEAAKELVKAGAKVVPVNYDDHKTLVNALKGIEVLISTLSGAGFAYQSPLVKAAKEAGVKLVAPSEFGVDTANQSPDSPLYVKTLLHAELKSLSLPYVLYNTGAFADWVPAILGPKDGKIVVVGTGETETSFTGIGDISRFVVHTLTTFPPAELDNRTFSLEGSRASPLSIAKLYQSKDSSIKIEHESIDDALKRWQEKHDFLAWLKVEVEAGRGFSYPEGGKNSNDVWKEWNPRDVKEFVTI